MQLVIFIQIMYKNPHKNKNKRYIIKQSWIYSCFCEMFATSSVNEKQCYKKYAASPSFFIKSPALGGMVHGRCGKTVTMDPPRCSVP